MYCQSAKIWIMHIWAASWPKQQNGMCAKRRPRTAWASSQSDQSLRCALSGYLRTWAFFMQTAKTLIRLGRCPGWSESSLGAHATLLVLSWGGSICNKSVCVFAWPASIDTRLLFLIQNLNITPGWLNLIQCYVFYNIIWRRQSKTVVENFCFKMRSEYRIILLTISFISTTTGMGLFFLFLKTLADSVARGFVTQ